MSLPLTIIIIWIIISAIVYFTLLLSQSTRLKKILQTVKDCRVSLVTAHPDDECMFFGPVIGSALSLGDESLNLLCLSIGNFYGVGHLRKPELFEAAKMLGIRKELVTLVDDEELPDSMQTKWPKETIVKYVKENYNSQEVLLTFDSKGVSKHPNHTSLFDALSTEPRTGLYLISIPFLLQYTGALTCAPFILGIYFFKKISGENVHLIVASPSTWFRTIRAMLCHKSQLMWFRILHVMLSSYFLFNIIDVSDGSTTNKTKKN